MSLEFYWIMCKKHLCIMEYYKKVCIIQKQYKKKLMMLFENIKRF